MWLLLALGSAVFFGLRGALYQWTSQQPMDRNLMLLGVYFTGAFFSLAAALLLNQQWNSGALVGMLMGFFSFIANGSMYKAFSVGKASVVAIITSLPPVVVVIIAFLAWNETLNLNQAIAFILIMAGTLLVRYSSDLSVDQLKGMHWALLATLCFGLNDIFSKQSTRMDAEVFPVLSVMFMTGSLLFLAVWLRERAKRRTVLPLTPETVEQEKRKWSIPGTFFWGMTVGLTNLGGMILIWNAFKIGVTGLVSAVVVTNVLIILLYARLYLKEKFRPFELIGMGLSIGGIVLLHLLG